MDESRRCGSAAPDKSTRSAFGSDETYLGGTSMIKRTMLLLAALAALFAPAAAQGAELRDSEGNPLGGSAEITATSSNMTITTASGTIVCASATLYGGVAENFPEVFIPISSTTMEGCKIKGLNIPVPFTTSEVSPIHLAEGQGWTSTTFKYDIPAVGLSNCHFEGVFELAYKSESDVVSLPGSALTAGASPPPGCPTTGLAHGSFTLEDALGPVTIY